MPDFFGNEGSTDHGQGNADTGSEGDRFFDWDSEAGEPAKPGGDSAPESSGGGTGTGTGPVERPVIVPPYSAPAPGGTQPDPATGPDGGEPPPGTGPASPAT